MCKFQLNKKKKKQEKTKAWDAREILWKYH